MIKQVIAIAAAALLCAGAQAAYKDGTYTGEGQGNASVIKVQVTVKDGKVVEVKDLENGETPMLFEAAKGEIFPAVVEKNGVDGVEAVSGASNSSKGILTAVGAALKQAQ